MVRSSTFWYRAMPSPTAPDRHNSIALAASDADIWGDAVSFTLGFVKILCCQFSGVGGALRSLHISSFADLKTIGNSRHTQHRRLARFLRGPSRKRCTPALQAWRTSVSETYRRASTEWRRRRKVISVLVRNKSGSTARRSARSRGGEKIPSGSLPMLSDWHGVMAYDWGSFI